ncbi:MAG: glutaredoxin family protein [Coriobacteriia bacterium]|nr:glutaredoxin family protein [Coriobacteriia bacterium]
MANPKRVTLFTTQACKWCKVAKAYLEDNDIEYVEVDIIHDAQARQRMALMTGQYGVPVLEIGSRAMVGWDEAEFQRLYHLKPKS